MRFGAFLNSSKLFHVFGRRLHMQFMFILGTAEASNNFKREICWSKHVEGSGSC